MSAIKFNSVIANLLDERIPRAFDEALENNMKAEVTIYIAIAKCLEEHSDVSLEFDENDPVSSFFDSWNRDGYIDGALSYSENEEGKRVLSCRFDLYDIRDTFETINDKLFGTVSSVNYSSKIDDAADVLSFSFSEANAIEEGFQNVKLPRKNSSEQKG